MKQAEKEILMTNEITMKTETEMELGNYGRKLYFESKYANITVHAWN
jgi:hypothetical protein